MRSRVYQALDILSTWSRDAFPTEVQPGITDRLMTPRPIADCYQKEDLEASLLFGIVNDPHLYQPIRELVPEDRCAEYFEQKLKRRIDGEFTAFDLLMTPPGQLETTEQLRTEVGEIAARLRYIFNVAAEDVKRREFGEAETAARLISALQAVCSRTTSPPTSHRGTTRRSSRAPENLSLFQYLIGQPPPKEPAFGLEALGALSDKTRAAQRPALDQLRSLLVDNKAPHEYLAEFLKVTGVAAAEEEGPSQEQSESRTSQKRPAGGGGGGSGRGGGTGSHKRTK